jgi:hypothetical protein
MTLTIRRLSGIALAAMMLLAPATAFAQESRSATAAIELVKMFDSMKLDSFAVKGGSGNEYVAALYFPGTQLLVVSAKFDSPFRADSLLQMKNYRDLYIELNSASQPQTKVFVADLSANGLRPKKDGSLFDTADVAGKSFSFDGDWKKAKISEDDYTKAYSTADEQYSQMIQALLGGLKKSS